MSKKAVVISDTHNFHKDLDVPDGDILFHAGDFTLMGNPLEVIDFNEWLGTLEHNYKVVIAGNHDKCVSDGSGHKQITNAIYLQNESVEIDGLNIWGSPMTPAFNRMREGLAFYTRGDKEAKSIWSSIPEDLDILMTHGPPYGILDEVIDYASDGKTFKENCGDRQLISEIIKKKPRFSFFGHIHEQYGTYKPDPRMDPYETTFINASVVNEYYNLINKPVELHL